MKDSGLIEIGLGLGFVACLVCGTGCVGSTMSNHDFIMAGSEKAMQIYHDAQLNAMKQMVEPHNASTHLERRKIEVEADTLQNNVGKTFWQRITANAKEWRENVAKKMQAAPSVIHEYAALQEDK